MPKPIQKDARISISIPLKDKKHYKKRAIENDMTLSDYFLTVAKMGESVLEKGTIHKSIYQMKNGESETMTAQIFKKMLYEDAQWILEGVTPENVHKEP